MIEITHFNLAAVVVVFLINVIVGAFWYSPVAFGGIRWKKWTGVDMLAMPKREANRNVRLVALACAVQAVLLAVIVGATRVSTIGGALLLGLILWACFIAGSTVGDTLYARRGIRVYGVNTIYFLVVLLIDTVILALWR